jgi:hypothetical protein
MADHQTIKEKDFSRGIDARSAETELAPGFVEDAINLDVAQGRMRKRNGYGHFVSIPISVKSVTLNSNTDEIEFTLPSSVDLSGIPVTPIIVYGSVDTNIANADLTTATKAVYYTEGRPSTTIILPSPYAGAVTVPTPQFTTDEFSVYTTEKTIDGNSTYDVTSLSISQTTLDVTIDYTPGADAIVSYLYYVDRSASDVTSHTLNNDGTSQDFTISAAGWSPATTNIGIEVWEDTGTSFTKVVPDAAEIIDTATGDVKITMRPPDSGGTTDYRVILTSIPEASTASFALSGETTAIINIPNAVTPYISPYVFVSTVGGTYLSLCEVDKIEYDKNTNSHNLTIVNIDPNAYALQYSWEYGNITANKLVVDNAGGAVSTHTYTNSQLVIYGLLPSDVYTGDGDGWVNHVDGYIKEGVASAITSIHGNVFIEYTKDEVSLPSLYAAINGRTASDLYIGPAFQPATSLRTSGDIVSTDVDGTNQLPCTSATWQSGNLVKYSLKASSNVVSGTPIVANDILSISQMSHSFLNGDFSIVSVTYNTNSIDVFVTNTDIIDSSFDDANTLGFAGVFTDQIPLSTTGVLPGAKYFLPGDLFTSSGLSTFQTTVAAISGDTLIVNGLTQLTQFAAGTKVTGSRTSDIIPLRNSIFVSDVDEIVAGDVVLNNKIVKFVNNRADEAVTSSGTTLTVADSSFFEIGSKILLARDGEYAVVNVLNTTTLELDATPTLASGVILGKYIAIDREVEIEDCTTCTLDVERRLYEATAPSTVSTLTTNKQSSYLSATPDSGSLPLRSTMVSDNMYFVDGTNMPLKLDGTNCIRPSLPNFNPIYSTRFKTGGSNNFGQTSASAFKTAQGYLESTGKNRITIRYASSADYKATDVNNFAPGDYIRLSASGEEMFAYVDHVEVVDAILSGGSTNKVTEETVPSNTTNTAKVGYIYVDRTLTPSSHSIDENFSVSKCYIYKYYARLNYLDANRNIIASAAQGYFDTTILQYAAGEVKHKFIQPPVFDLFDYDKLELELYRTKADSAVFYKVVTLPLAFLNGEAYIEFTDTVRDDDLLSQDPTSLPINGEVGTTFHGLPIAKHITSINSSLVVGDITSEPELSINVEKVSASAALSDFSGKTFKIYQDATGTTGLSSTFEWVASSTTVVGTKVAGTSGTVTITDTHSFSVGDWIYITYHTTLDEDVQPYIGWHQISAVSTTVSYSFKCKVAVEMGDTSNFTVVKASTTTRIPVYTGADAAYSNSVGNSSTPLILLMYRLSQAINASQRAMNIAISGQTTFTPWVMAHHNDQRAGGIILTSPKYSSTELGVDLPAPSNPTYYKWYANGSIWASGKATSEQIRYPSRLLASYQNYPELFDSPYAIRAADSDSAIDVNPSDGQEITGIIPFFGDTAFGAALRGGVLVVFKQNSIYLVDLAVKAQGLNPVQRLETNGIGCTYPRSIAVSKHGIFFAHRSGVYALRRDLTLQYVGKMTERLFEAGDFTEAYAHHSPLDKKYMLAYSQGTAGVNDGHLVYNHSQEEEGQLGSWTRFTGHNVTGWANLNSDEIFSTYRGELCLISKTDTSDDFNDIGEAIEATLVCRAMDFGDSGIRKQVRHVFTHFRAITDLTSVALYVAVDMDVAYSSTDAFQITKGITGTSLALTGKKKAITLGHTLPAERGEYFQIKIVEGGLNEAIDLIGLDYTVLGLSHHGIPDSSSTKRK